LSEFQTRRRVVDSTMSWWAGAAAPETSVCRACEATSGRACRIPSARRCGARRWGASSSSGPIPTTTPTS
jgi:hypothetical protein